MQLASADADLGQMVDRKVAKRMRDCPAAAYEAKEESRQQQALEKSRWYSPRHGILYTATTRGRQIWM